MFGFARRRLRRWPAAGRRADAERTARSLRIEHEQRGEGHGERAANDAIETIGACVRVPDCMVRAGRSSTLGVLTPAPGCKSRPLTPEAAG